MILFSSRNTSPKSIFTVSCSTLILNEFYQFFLKYILYLWTMRSFSIFFLLYNHWFKASREGPGLALLEGGVCVLPALSWRDGIGFGFGWTAVTVRDGGVLLSSSNKFISAAIISLRTPASWTGNGIDILAGCECGKTFRSMGLMGVVVGVLGVSFTAKSVDKKYLK